jgi:hypothetical protein
MVPRKIGLIPAPSFDPKAVPIKNIGGIFVLRTGSIVL